MDFCENYQIYLLLDLHTAPGGQNRTGIPITIRESPVLALQSVRDQIATLWGYIAEHYKEKEYLLGYDVLNEPILSMLLMC